MVALTVIVGVFLLVLEFHNCHGCAPSCKTLMKSDPPFRKTIERALVSSIDEAQWRGTCHSFCVKNVRLLATILAIYELYYIRVELLLHQLPCL